MKKIVSIILLLALMATLSSCRDDKETNLYDTAIVDDNQLCIEINKDLNQDGVKEKIMLYNDGLDIKLKVDNSTHFVFKIESLDQIEGQYPNNTYHFDLSVINHQIIVGGTYEYTNKYGSSSWISAYHYDDSQVSQLWTSNQILEDTFAFEGMDIETRRLNVSLEGNKKSMLLDQNEADEYSKYIDYQLEENGQIPDIELNHILSYQFDDVDEDGAKEIIVEAVAVSGASPLSDRYNAIYKVFDEEIREVDGHFRSVNDE